VFTTTNLGRPVKIPAPMKTHHESLRVKATPSLLQRTWWGMGPKTPEACSHPKLTNNSRRYCNSRWAGPVPIWAGLKETALYFRCLRKFLLYHRHWQLACAWLQLSQKRRLSQAYLFSFDHPDSTLYWGKPEINEED